MMKTPNANRKHIALFGATNVGKSSLFNALLDQQRAIVSDKPGTTTDPVEKAIELLPFGPVVLVDTAGLLDDSALGPEREAATRRILARTDLALFVSDTAQEPPAYREMQAAFQRYKLPHLVALSKTDLHGAKAASWATAPVVPVSVHDEASIEALKQALCQALAAHSSAEPTLLGDLLAPGDVAVLVIPIDSEAPKGRLILPQAQVIRECLDNDLRCHVTHERTLAAALAELPRVDLVVTDAQIFGLVSQIVPETIRLTSFSMLMARQKGDLQALYAGTQALAGLKAGGRVLIAEACTHNRTHEDIGRVKLPRILEKAAGAELQFDFCNGRDFPQDVTPYALVVHCGACMITARAFAARQAEAAAHQVPMTNYGMVQAWASGILERSMTIFTPR